MAQVTTFETSDWVLTYLEGLCCPRAVSVAILYRAGLIEDIQTLGVLPVHYIDADSYRRAAAATKLLSKITSFEGGELDPQQTALDTWYAAEKQCFYSNQRFNELADFGTLNGEPNDVALRFLKAVREEVTALIGDRPPLVIEGRFGPGATQSDKFGRTNVLHKMSTTPTMTASAWIHMFRWMQTKWFAAVAARGDFGCKVVHGNTYFQVPKNAVTNRSCAKEPSLNAFYQRGYGEVLVARLTRAGFDFKHAKDIHMQVACKASKTGAFATLDLKSASDTVSSALVRAVLPPRWFYALNSLRAKSTWVPDNLTTPKKNEGKWIRLEKFSSMGNGFTFELEMVIFTAIIKAVCPDLVIGHDLWVWGDDLIVPTGSAEIVKKALHFCGFTINDAKSFVEGPFRESCGGDYWDGEAVRPYYLQEFPNAPQENIATANGIRRMAYSDPKLKNGLRSDLLGAWFRVLDRIPSAIRSCRGPLELGDLVIWDEESRWSTRLRSSIRYVKVYRPADLPSVRFDRFDPDIQYGAALYGIRLSSIGIPQTRSGRPSTYPRWYTKEGQDRRTAPVRGDPLGYKVGWTPYS